MKWYPCISATSLHYFYTLKRDRAANIVCVGTNCKRKCSLPKKVSSFEQYLIEMQDGNNVGTFVWSKLIVNVYCM